MSYESIDSNPVNILNPEESSDASRGTGRALNEVRRHHDNGDEQCNVEELEQVAPAQRIPHVN